LAIKAILSGHLQQLLLDNLYNLLQGPKGTDVFLKLY